MTKKRELSKRDESDDVSSLTTTLSILTLVLFCPISSPSTVSRRYSINICAEGLS